MVERTLKVENLEETTYLPAPGIGEPEGILRRKVTFTSLEFDEAERDVIVATLWDFLTEYDLKVGDTVLATLQFGVFHFPDGTSHQHVDVIDIKKVIDYDDNIW